MKPLLKWAGGKRQIVPLISENLPQDWSAGTYFEPFIGGAAVFLNLQPSRAVISDINPRLIGFYSNVSSSCPELIDSIQTIAESFNSQGPDAQKDFYLNLRSKFNQADPLSLESSALFFVLNKLCFNGLYRENAKGGFNVPFGQKTKFPEVNIEDFEKASELLGRTQVLNLDFEESVKDAQAGDFVYFDPPYIPVDATSSFTSYVAGGFGLESQSRLAKTLKDLELKGVRGLLSNSDTPLTREIYKGFRLTQIVAPRMVSAKSSGRGNAPELLIANY